MIRLVGTGLFYVLLSVRVVLVCIVFDAENVRLTPTNTLPKTSEAPFDGVPAVCDSYTYGVSAYLVTNKTAVGR